MSDLRSRKARFPIIHRETFSGSGGPAEPDYPTETPILPPGEFAVTFCVDQALWVEMRSALMFGARTQYNERYYYLIEQLNIAEQTIGDCELDRMYRQNGCDLQVTLDGGQTWANVPPGPDGVCEPENGTDGRTPELRAVDLGEGCVRYQWRYLGEENNAWRTLSDVCSGQDGQKVVLESDLDDGCLEFFWRYEDEPSAARRSLGRICEGQPGKNGRTPVMEARQDGEVTRFYWRYADDPRTARRLLTSITVPQLPETPDDWRTCAGVDNLMEWLDHWCHNVLDYIDYEGLMDQIIGQNGTWAVSRRTDTSGAILNYLRVRRFAPGLPPSAYRNAVDVDEGSNPNCSDPELAEGSPPYSDQQGWVCDWLVRNNFDTFFDDYPYAGDPIIYGNEEGQRASLTRWGWERAKNAIFCHLSNTSANAILPLSYIAIEGILRGSGYGLSSASLPALLWRLAGRDVVNAVYQKGRCNTDCRCGCDDSDLSYTVQLLNPQDEQVSTSPFNRTRRKFTVRVTTTGVLPNLYTFFIKCDALGGIWHQDQVEGGGVSVGFWPDGPALGSMCNAQVPIEQWAGGVFDIDLYADFPRQLSFGPSGVITMQLETFGTSVVPGSVVGDPEKIWIEV